jgi:hypothetical protein
MFRRRSGIPSNIRGIERFVWGLYSAPIHSLQFPVQAVRVVKGFLCPLIAMGCPMLCARTGEN